MRTFQFLAAFALAVVAVPASAVTLLTSSVGYTGPTFYVPTGSFVNSAGPITFFGGITYSSNSNNSVFGVGSYGFAGNGGALVTPMVGTNDETSTITLTFATPVAMFGGGMNYAADQFGPYGDNPVIAAFDENNNLIGSFDLFTLAPISTPNGADEFVFRGIDGGGTLIKSFTISGTYIALAGVGVPEPANWAMLIAGFGLAGAVMRRRRAVGLASAA